MTIESIAFGGEGILRTDGLVVFVPFTAPGDVVSIEVHSKKKNFARGKLLRLVRPSPARIEPRCFYFGNCGGCQLQHMNYPAQVEAKRFFILDALKRIGKIEVADLAFHPAIEQWHYRRHIRLKLKKEGQGFKAGYTGCDPSQFIQIAKCPIFLPSEDSLLGTLEPLLSNLSNEGIEEGSLRLIKTDKEKFILAFSFFPVLPANFQQVLNLHPKWQGVVASSPNEKISVGDVNCETEFLGLKAHFSPFGFLQNHPQQSENLYRAILDALPQSYEKILDLYCGIGITSLLFAKQNKKVWGVELHPETLALAKENARLNNLTVHFIEGKAEIEGTRIMKEERPGAVLCNPPRTGIDPKLLQVLIAEKPACIVYVSCMPSTLARDLQKLLHAGYQITSIQGFDMFPQTTHVETLVVLKKC